jgi:hypothetical protein
MAPMPGSRTGIMEKAMALAEGAVGRSAMRVLRARVDRRGPEAA